MTATSAQVVTTEDKKTESPADKPKSWGRRIGRILFRVSVSLVVLIFFAQLIWKFSGSNQWEKVLDEDGIKVYTLKSPGTDVVQFRAIGKIHSTLAGVVAWMKNPDTCKIQGCTESYEVERVGDLLQYNYFQYDFSPFGKRDFVIRSQFYQNPNNKEVLLAVAAIADKVPPKEGFFRVTDMNNKWRLTPLENGDLEVEIENNLDFGGYAPMAAFNLKRPQSMKHILTHLQGWTEKYQSAKFDFIKEKNSAPATHISQASTAP
jgi:hypothetical protein